MLLTSECNAQLTEINKLDDVCSLQMWPTEDASFRLRNGLGVALSFGGSVFRRMQSLNWDTAYGWPISCQGCLVPPWTPLWLRHCMREEGCVIGLSISACSLLSCDLCCFQVYWLPRKNWQSTLTSTILYLYQRTKINRTKHYLLFFLRQLAVYYTT